MAEERTLEVNAERLRAICVRASLRLLYRGRQFFERGHRRPHRRGYGCGTVAGNAVCRQQLLDTAESVVRALHHVASGAAVDVNIDEAGGENGVAEVDDLSAGGNFDGIASSGGDND